MLSRVNSHAVVRDKAQDRELSARGKYI